MIVWLASYPRSGNTLMRTVLKKCMGYESYDDQVDEALRKANSSSEVEEAFGHLSLPVDWVTFYNDQCGTQSRSFVKTHLPPRDDQPAIYIARDGRKAILSYFHFHRKFFPKKDISLEQLILGIDEYNSWTEHINLWSPFENIKILLLRYEDLVSVSHEDLERISYFIQHQGPIAEWKNPFEALRNRIPKFYREGEIHWQGDPEWTESINRLFFYCHGEMMVRLGYASESEVEKYVCELTPDMKKIIDLARQCKFEWKMYERECRLRLDVINNLKTTCDERLELINLLDSKLRMVAR